MLKTVSFVLLFSTLCTVMQARDISVSFKPADTHTIATTVTFDMPHDSFIYKDFLRFSINHPHVEATQWHSSKNSVSHYSSHFQETKSIFKQKVSFTFTIVGKTSRIPQQLSLLVSYVDNESHTPTTQAFPFSFGHEGSETAQVQSAASQPLRQEATQKSVPSERKSWTQAISNLLEQSNNIWLRALLAVLLGVLLSLTPCIYPMIPITVGILQAQGTKSVFRNFLASLCYTFGVATTFSLFGLLASFSGHIFGQMLASPVFVIVLIVILSYFALSMFGWYDIYIPKFLKPNVETYRAGSVFLTSYLFGLASGTVASPCVSPGLALLLTIVASIGNVATGFLLLFAFGVGISFPLLIIGTFSGSMNVMPKAGSWMIEVKKIFGFLLFGLCLYYLGNLLDPYIIAWSIAGFVALIGLYYLISSLSTRNSSAMRIIKQCGAGILLAASFILGFRAYQQHAAPITDTTATQWHTDYTSAQAYAQQHNKRLFLDFWSTFCTICTTIDADLLSQNAVSAFLNNTVVPVKIDIKGAMPGTQDVLKQYDITGVPTFILVDAHSGAILHQWSSEIADMTADEFIADVTQYL